MKSLQAWAIAGALGMVAVCAGCGAENGAGDASASENAIASQSEDLSGHHRHAVTPTPTSTATPTSTSSAPAATASGGAPATPTVSTAADVASIVAAAQTPDGMAIPQAAEPGGQCAPVVVALGFWACPTVDQTCSYTADSARHDCTCVRSQGEGQTPSWVCD